VVIIDIGCGERKHPNATVGVDILPLPGVDHVCDFEKDPLPFATGSVDAVYSSHTLEHVRNLEHLLREIIRVLKPGGIAHIVVPHFSCTFGHSDPTHKRLFGIYSFNYFSREKDANWTCPSYTNDIWFKIRRKTIRWKHRRFGLDRVYHRVFNRSPYMQYLYEWKFAWILPCYEVEFELVVA